RAVCVLRRQLEGAAERMSGPECQREHRKRLRQVEEDRLPPALALLAQKQVGDEGPSRSEHGEGSREREERLVREQQPQGLAIAGATQLARVMGGETREPVGDGEWL